MNWLHLVGSPGTGKTTALLGRVDMLLRHGIRPEQICFTSFTRAAVGEALARLRMQHGLQRHDLPFFGTLHSLAYRHLCLNQENRLTPKRWREFCAAAHLRFTDPGPEVDEDPAEPVGQEEGDALRRFYDWRRQGCLEFAEAFRQFDPGEAPWSRARAEWFEREFEAFKDALCLFDFTDMLLHLDRDRWRPEARVLMVDEAQDLSTLQRRILVRWAQEIGNVIWAYDEDQAIYSFQHAEPSWLLDLPGRREFLSQSFRVPQAPAAVALRIIGRNRTRYRKTWTPKADRGAVFWDAALSDVVRRAEDRSSGSWFFLARNRYYLGAFAEALKDAAIPYVNLRGPTPRVSGAIVAALTLASGCSVSLEDIRRIGDATTQKEWWVRGAKAAVEARIREGEGAQRVTQSDLAALGALPGLVEALGSPRTCLRPLKGIEGTKAFFLAVWQKRGVAGLTEQSWATLSTMHGAKGGERRNVVLSPNMTRRTARGMEDDPESERRVWYVGCSRTEENLFILEPSAGATFEDW